jgi:putative ABC transport system substrate-binding protein
MVIPDTYSFERRDVVIALARRRRLLAPYGHRYFARSGGLLAYAVDAWHMMCRAADYVDRILRGAKPADLPVQLPTKVELIVNLKTATALSLTFRRTCPRSQTR